KATRQARDMKYFSPATDWAARQRELSANNPNKHEHDEYSEHAEKYDPYEDGFGEDSSHS
ncbi:MAG: DUF3073 domain-containing protein, partial [Yaniella sp.]|nr:DUF3073 domain-containing protein [Yaniella sp.]